MKPGGGKQKGAQFERDVCVLLSRWVSKGQSDSLFWRSAMSGGRATVRFAKGKSADGHGGDITATDPRGHALTANFVVECKHVADLGVKSAVVTGKGPLVAHWVQVRDDAERVGKRPMLIAKQNLMPALLLVRHCDFKFYFGETAPFELARLFCLEGYQVSMFGLQQFLEAYPYDQTRFAPLVRLRPRAGGRQA